MADDLADRARGVLDRNWTGRHTRPGPRLYPHQWSWDSAFVAIGLACHDAARARAELSALFEGQWRNGLVPQIVFDPGGGEYFPGPDAWRTDVSPDAPTVVQTSGIVQPPLHAAAVLAVHRRDPDHAWLRDMLPRLRAWHAYLYRERQVGESGLVAIRHPWESGRDDSPAWDGPLARIPLPAGAAGYRRVDLTMVAADQRPSDVEYDHYVALVECFKREGYDEAAIARGCRFRVVDPLFCALLAASGNALAEIESELGEPRSGARDDAARTAGAIEERLWSDAAGCYVAWDAVEDAALVARTSGGFAPLFAGFAAPERVERMAAELAGPSFRPRGGYGVTGYDARMPGFVPRRYWRGPVWINLNWLILRGLERHGRDAEAAALREATLGLVERSGFHEYFDARTGEGLGTDDFSWTAALTLDLLAG